MRQCAAGVSVIAVLVLSAGGWARAADLPPQAPILSPEPSGPPSAFSAGPTFGTDGIGFQVGYRDNPSFGGRATLSLLKYDAKFTASDLRVKGSVEFIDGTLMADWYPFEGGFRVSGGLRFGQNRVKVRAEATNGTFVVGGLNYNDVTGITSITGKAQYNPVIPVLTIGYAGQPSTALPLLLSIDAGIAYVGTSKVTLSAEGPQAGDAIFQRRLRDQEASIKREVNKHPIVPVLNVAAVYRF